MNVSSSDEDRSDEDLFQDMEAQLYSPLPDGLVERDWLNLPVMEKEWMELPEMKRDWLNLPEIEQQWLDAPDTHEQIIMERTSDDTPDFDFDI